MSGYSSNVESDWQTSKDTLKGRMKHLLENNTFSDCQFKVGNKLPVRSFGAHKLLLAASSPVFEANLYGRWAENVIVVTDIEADVFEALLKYIYTEEISSELSDLYFDLYYAAKKYMIWPLTKKCIESLTSRINCGNACRVYEFAERYEESSLMEICLNIMKTQTAFALTEANLKDVKISTIITILDQNALNIQSEVTLFNAVEICYYENNEEVKDKTPLNERAKYDLLLREALKRIRFLTMTPQAFAEGPGLSNVLTESEKNAIFMNIASTKKLVPMPAGFSMVRSKREIPGNISYFQTSAFSSSQQEKVIQRMTYGSLPQN